MQGHGASQGPEPLAVQRLYFNVYLLQRETAFGFEPLMRRKYIKLKNTVCLACHWVKGWGHMTEPAYRIYLRDTHDHKIKNWCLAGLLLSFLITQQHVRDPTADGEQTSRLWALQGALQHLHLRGSGEQSWAWQLLDVPICGWDKKVMGQFSPPVTRGASSLEMSHLAHTPEQALWAPRPDATVGKRLKSLWASRLSP